MGRRRAAESVPAVEEGIEEVIIKHTRTKWGVWTTEKVVPVLIPSKEKPGQTSHSKKGKQRQGGPEPERAEGSGVQSPFMEDIEAHQFVEEQVDDLPDLEHEPGQPQASVCTRLHLHGMETLIQYRL
jgi:hypothetical protein